MKRKYRYLLILITAFFMLSPDVKAIKFAKKTSLNGGYVYFNWKYSFSRSYSSEYYHTSVIKIYTKNGGDTWGNAFCSNRNLNFSSGTSYTEDTTYKNKAKCKYKVKNANGNWEDKYGGDCSQLMGYIIKAAYDKATKVSWCKESDTKMQLCKYNYAQAAVWVNLRLFTYKNGNSSYLQKNNNETECENAFKNNSTINSIFYEGWKKYAEAEKENQTEKEKVISANLYTVTGGSNNKFYYEPDSDACGASGGKYKTQITTIKNVNPDKKTIEFTISPQSTGFDIVIVDDSGKETIVTNENETGYKTEIQYNKELKFYLLTRKFLGTKTQNVATAKVSYYAEVKGEKITTNKSYDTYDSERWTKSGYQGLVLLVTKSKSYKITTPTLYQEQQEATFQQDRLEFNEPTDPGVTDGKGKCANIATNSNEINTELKKSICKTIRLDSNRSVRIIVTENIHFNYGYLYPAKYNDKTQKPIVFSGGSFNLNTDTTLGAITSYKVGISWIFADKNMATGKPYYYNRNDLNDTNADKQSIIDDINKILLDGQGEEKGIKQKYSNLILKVDTFNSNILKDDGTGKDHEYKFNIYLTAQNKTKASDIKFENKKLELTISNIELRRYRLEEGANGIVKYCELSDPCEHRGYFVPMHYPDGKFKFNIKKQDISIVDGINLNYEGECNIDVENRYGSLRYRDIDLKNPFPKANVATGEGMPANWKDWYSLTSNQNRIHDTYTKAYIYSININEEKAKKIDEINRESVYTEWANMNNNGTSDMILDLFDKRANNTSYCGLGEFKESCDK